MAAERTVQLIAHRGESADAPKWAALARAHHHRAGQLLSPDGYYYEGMEYWIFRSPRLCPGTKMLSGSRSNCVLK